MGSENDDHSNVADIKDTDGESGEKADRESSGAPFPVPQVDGRLPAKFWSHSSCMRLLCLSRR